MRSFFRPLVCLALTSSAALPGCLTDLGGDDRPSAPSDGSAAGPSAGRVMGMLEAHNRVRAAVDSGSALTPLLWSEEIAAFAQAWADTLAADDCALRHRPDGDLRPRNYGENVAFFGRSGGGAASSGELAVMGWAAEKACWTYGTIGGLGVRGTEQCDARCVQDLSSDGCGHYTAIVWRDTTAVGCGVATCSGGGSTRDVWVCNYAPAGNFVGRAPY